jgi:hypothetical protein
MKHAALFAVMFAPLVANADHRTARPAAAPSAKVSAPRSIGVHVTAHPEQPMHVKNNPPHQVIYHNAVTKKDEQHAVVVDHRPSHVIDRDPHLRVVVRGYHPTHDWARFHIASGGWFQRWGITAWDEVGTVTCEAVNESNGELYPVSEDRDSRAWDDGTVNTILDQALDDCFASSGGSQCGPATPSCSFQQY